MIREKEKDVEKVEERGHGLILNKREEICTVITETLQSLNHTWANLDHMVGFSALPHSPAVTRGILGSS